MTNVLINDQELTELRRIFEACDKNKDGMLCREELTRSMQEVTGLLEVEDQLIDEIFESVDKAGNNLINFREFAQAALDTRILLKEENLEKAF